MAEPLPILIEKAIQIAWDYLERTGGLESRKLRAGFCSIRWS